jgi:hypothetical protein
MNTEIEILSAKRSTCNESEAKDMAGCLADGGRVICYFPGEYGMRQASLLAAAPELLAALEDAEFLLRKAGLIAGPMQDSFKRSATDARAAITKATTPNA